MLSSFYLLDSTVQIQTSLLFQEDLSVQNSPGIQLSVFTFFLYMWAYDNV